MYKKAYQNKKYIQNKHVLRWLYSNECWVIGCERNSEDTHHVDGNNNNNSIFNLIPVCKSCHRLIEKSNIKITNVEKHHLKKLISKINYFLPKAISS